MNRIPDYMELTCDIVAWICDYCSKHSIKSLVVGVSGGIDSAVSSTLAAKTGLPVYAVGMPCLLYTSPSPRDQRGSRMPSSA